MADSNSTKSALADAMKKLMVCKSFAKISISDLCEECGLNRKSFYYHFKDKYDLVNWIFYVDFLTNMGGKNFENEWDVLVAVCNIFYQNKAFYGVPELTNSEGLHTNAIYGFLNIMFKILEEEKPDYLAVAFDVHAPTFRHQMYQAYKGTRKPMPEELRQQVPVMKEVLKAMHITIMEQAGLEADDILGTLAKKAEQAGLEVSLVSGDRDLLQIATDHIKIRIPKTKQGRTEIEDYYAADVLAAYQVTPLQFIELKALMGDTADNIPGVPKVGEKTAQALMVEYGSLDNIYAHVEEISKKSIRESLETCPLPRSHFSDSFPIDFAANMSRRG